MFMDKKVIFVGWGKPPEMQRTEKGVEKNQGLNGEKGKHNPCGRQCSDMAQLTTLSSTDVIFPPKPELT